MVAAHGTWPLPGVPRSFSEMWTWLIAQIRRDHADRVLLLDIGVEGVVEQAVVRVVDPPDDAAASATVLST